MELEETPDGRVKATEQLEEGLKVQTILLGAKAARRMKLKLVKKFGGLFAQLLQEELQEETQGEKEKSKEGAIKQALPKLFEEIQKQDGIFDVYEEIADQFLPLTTVYRDNAEGQEVEFILKNEKRQDILFASDRLLEEVLITFCLRANFKSFLDAFQSGRGASLFQKAAGTMPTE